MASQTKNNLNSTGRFRLAVRQVVLMFRACHVFMSYSSSHNCMEFNTLEISSTQPAGEGKNLVFDPNYFRMKEDRIPQRLVEIMQKHPEWRSEEEVHHLQKFMSSKDVFRRYSMVLQLLVARVVRYQRLGRRRVVVRRGHAGQSLYLVWSGTLAMTKDDDGSSAFVDREPFLIKPGMIFGDVALIKGLRRNATVVCMDVTELMVIDKEEFFQNHIDLELKREFEDHFSFFRSLELFSSWSSCMIEQMTVHSKTERFRFGHIVDKHVNNDTTSLIFIAEGQCDVLRMVDLTSCSSYRHRVKHQHTGKALSSDLPKSACFLIDSLHQGSVFGLNDYLLPGRQRDQRSFTLLSQSVQVLRVERSLFDELVDSATLEKLEALQKTYPSDEELCKFFLEHKRWQDYKQRLVQHLTPCHVHREHVTQTPFRVTRDLRTPQFHMTAERLRACRRTRGGSPPNAVHTPHACITNE